MSEAQSVNWTDALPSVLAHADWRTRGYAPAVCREWQRPLAHGEAHWRWLCERLQLERGLYLSPGPCPHVDGWRAHFALMWARRNMWTPAGEVVGEAAGATEASSPEGEAFNVSVSVRFRPAVATAGGAETGEDEGDNVVMPLHQRAAMVRAARGCSQAAAMRIVMKERSKAAKKDDDFSLVAAPERPSEEALEAARRRTEAAAAAHMAVVEEDAPAAAARAARKPHLEGRAQGRREDTRRRTHAGLPREQRIPVADASAAGASAAADTAAAGKDEMPMPRSDSAEAAALAAAIAATAPEAAKKSAEEAAVEAAQQAEARRLATIEAARAAAAEKRAAHRAADAELAAFKQQAAASAASAASAAASSSAPSPYALQGKENEETRNDAAAGAGRRDGACEPLAAGSTTAAAEGEGEGADPEASQPGQQQQQQQQQQQAAGDAKAAIISVSSAKGEVLAMAPGVGLRNFRFGRVHETDDTQARLYEATGRTAVGELLNGQSGCVLVYGQTGSGKTYTMFGEGEADPRLPHSRRGLVPRVCDELLGAIEARRRGAGIDATLSVAYVEVFGSEVTDLLREGEKISSATAGAPNPDVADNFFHAHRWVLEGRSDVPVDSVEAAFELIRKGDACKRRAATAMNERSSRAHALVILSLVQRRGGVEVRNRLFLADLGGSEKLSRSDVAKDFKSLVIMKGDEEVSRISWREYYQHRARLQETLNINVGLFSLQRCIEALLQRDAARRAGRSGSQLPHVPYADSKLTLLLKDALEGGARTSVLICASLEPRNAVESIQTLRFGEACSRLEMRSGRNAADGAATLRRLVDEIDDEIAKTQAIIVRDQRWENQTKIRYDVVELKDDVSFQQTTQGLDGLLEHETAAGVMVADLTLGALDKRGASGFSRDELRGALAARGLDGRGDRAACFARLHAALTAEAAAEAAGEQATSKKQVIAHEVVSRVLVGAEEAEAKLEALLQRKRELLGEA